MWSAWTTYVAEQAEACMKLSMYAAVYTAHTCVIAHVSGHMTCQTFSLLYGDIPFKKQSNAWKINARAMIDEQVLMNYNKVSNIELAIIQC